MTQALPSDVFARRLRDERERAGISQAELARKMAQTLGTNVDPSALTRIEQRTRAVRLDEAVAMAEALDVPIMALLSEDADGENRALITKKMIELESARRGWERLGDEVTRLTREIQVLREA